ncbi:MAG TPA: amidohydrolase family protein [Acetobacteraceae bacterium]|nr:amidohydrolase family protein [Acetobacteraceae bacterium]
MLIVDAQVHIWGADTPERPWPATGHNYAHRDAPLGKDALLREMDAAGVGRVVIVPPSWEGDRNDLALEAARQHPDRFAIMGRLPLYPADPAALATWRRQPGMLGLRFTAGRESGWLTDGSADWVWEAAQRNGLPVMISCPGLLSAIDGIAERHPGLRLVIDHLALRRARDDAAYADIPLLCSLAKRPNVAAKASATPASSTRPYPYRNIHGYLAQVFDAFGPLRMFWGTDLTRLPCTYRQAVTMFTEELPFLSASDKSWVMGRALCAWLGWP